MTATLYKGSTSSFEAAQSAAVYEAVLTELGATGTIVPLGDPIYRTAATTWRSVSGVSGLETAVWTATEAPESFDTQPTRQGICPVLDLNGSDEKFNTPDNAYWSRDDNAGANGFSLGMWVNMDSVSGTIYFWDKGVSGEEWEWIYATGLRLIDDSVNEKSNRPFATALTVGQWAFIVSTYNGAGGASAADGINCYLNGSLDNGTANNNSNYVGMENLTETLGLFARVDGAEGFLNAQVAGGCAGPFFTQIELTAEQVMNLYRIGKGVLAL